MRATIRTRRITAIVATTLTLVPAGVLVGAPSVDDTLTVAAVHRDAYTLPMPGLPEADRGAFFRGRGLFRQAWVIAPSEDSAVDGLGPTYNRLTCIACHPRNGRGFAPDGPDEELRAMLVRLSVPDREHPGSGVPHPAYGDQLNELGIPGVPGEGRTVVRYDTRVETLADGTSVELRVPRIGFRDLAFGEFGPDVMTSARIGPAVYGMGLLDAIPDAALHALAAREGPRHGRVNLVPDAHTGRLVAGRFGAKANQASLRQQIAGAAHGDLGLTSDAHPAQNCPPAQIACLAARHGGHPELTEAQMDDMATYLRSLAVPRRRAVADAVTRHGEALFHGFGCADCHVPVLRTRADAQPAVLADREIHPYTDLLLHDMGPDLADGRPDHAASGREWRTPPLWGIGLAAVVEPRVGFLHDGRARSMLEAVLWHGGEGSDAREAVRRAAAADRAALLKFLESL